MCPSSYCSKHREGLLFISKLDGKLCCSEHDPCGPEPLEPGEIREYTPDPRALTSGLGMAVIPSAASNAAAGMTHTSKGVREISASSESLPAFSIPVPITIPVAPPAAAASPPPRSSDTPGSSHVFDAPHYSPISSYEEEEEDLLGDVEDEEEEEQLVDEGRQKSDPHEEDGEAVMVGVEYLEEDEDEEEEEDEEDEEE